MHKLGQEERMKWAGEKNLPLVFAMCKFPAEREAKNSVGGKKQES